MKIKIIFLDKITGLEITDEQQLMEMAGLNNAFGFEDIGVQGDGTPVVFDKCGNFGYIDAEHKIELLQ